MYWHDVRVRVRYLCVREHLARAIQFCVHCANKTYTTDLIWSNKPIYRNFANVVIHWTFSWMFACSNRNIYYELYWVVCAMCVSSMLECTQSDNPFPGNLCVLCVPEAWCIALINKFMALSKHEKQQMKQQRIKIYKSTNFRMFFLCFQWAAQSDKTDWQAWMCCVLWQPFFTSTTQQYNSHPNRIVRFWVFR